MVRLGYNASGVITKDEMSYYEAAKTFAEQVGGINLSQTSATTETADAPF